MKLQSIIVIVLSEFLERHSKS